MRRMRGISDAHISLDYGGRNSGDANPDLLSRTFSLGWGAGRGAADRHEQGAGSDAAEEIMTDETTIQFVYRYLRLYAATHQGQTPQRAAISAACHVSISSVDRILKRLEYLGFVQRSAHGRTTLRLIEREDTPPATTRPLYRRRYE